MTKLNYFHIERENNPKRREAFTADFLGKISPVNNDNLLTGCECLETILKRSLKVQSAGENILIIGLTESGIIPSILMQKVARENGMTTALLSSTRRPSTSGIVFTEKHSHGPNHSIPVPSPEISEIWIVEDELTTGNTVFEVLSRFCFQLKIKTIRIFALVDFRNKKQKKEAFIIAQSFDVKCIFQSFLVFTDTSFTDPKKILSTTINTENSAPERKNRLKDIGHHDSWLMYKYRSALYEQHNKEDNDPNWHLSDSFEDTTVLVIGETVDIATRLALKNPGFSFQHITLSPWKIDNASIVSRLDFDNKYFLYNYKNLSRMICILNDPIDKEISKIVKNKLEEYGFTVCPFPLTELIKSN
ncbi:phosphoribosyltransferase domain-containing protein [Desulforhopalus vacuolatus]|uniref:phosphoribosyltransferase domain-containing protein n=1 Tax=Desulforhopalus vacuolatus TaxID=40414 RepID=UPI001964387F|nr:phosphoribosyltransferase domain-containing protein [Desulforhopalus vacuolatus]MBM9518291.1 phosphoribosyltransferase domain-containing protein [Desulforhopalus vacuolatus]